MADAVIRGVAQVGIPLVTAIINAIQGQRTKSEDDTKMLQAAKEIQRAQDDITTLFREQQQMTKYLLEGMMLLMNNLQNGKFSNNEAANPNVNKYQIVFDLPDDPDERDRLINILQNVVKVGPQYVTNEQSHSSICKCKEWRIPEKQGFNDRRHHNTRQSSSPSNTHRHFGYAANYEDDDYGYYEDGSQRRPFHQYPEKEEERSYRHHYCGHNRDDSYQRGASSNYGEEKRWYESCHCNEDKDVIHKRAFSDHQEVGSYRPHYCGDEKDSRHQKRNSMKYEREDGCYTSQHSNGCDRCQRRPFHNCKGDQHQRGKYSEYEEVGYGGSRYGHSEDRGPRVFSPRQEAILDRYKESISSLQDEPYSHYEEAPSEDLRNDRDVVRADASGLGADEEDTGKMLSLVKDSDQFYDEDNDKGNGFRWKDSKGTHNDKTQDSHKKGIDWKNLKEEEDLQMAFAMSLSLLPSEQVRRHESRKEA